ncbi:hypothetical protein IHE45_08G164000 [Dioscorea alata]|uniref:Uncharacterized protein n=1 Tax=Dioscorea alata TaxID=55571 RepID=A0ACB7VNS3_DIOAL|nr:hypothetical protein IHE45_08G164000 [Dioscorea alata]
MRAAARAGLGGRLRRAARERAAAAAEEGMRILKGLSWGWVLRVARRGVEGLGRRHEEERAEEARREEGGGKGGGIRAREIERTEELGRRRHEEERAEELGRERERERERERKVFNYFF